MIKERSIAVWALAAAPPSLVAAIILWGMAGIAPAEWVLVWPFPFDRALASSANPLLAVVWSAITAWIVYRAWRSLPDDRTRRIWMWLLAYLSWVFLALWIFLPALGRIALSWLAPVLIVILVPAFSRAGRAVLSGADLPTPPLRQFLWADVLIVGVPGVIALVSVDGPDWSSARAAFLRTLLIYPPYAYLQLLLFLSMPVLLLRRLGVPDRLVAASVAAVFALLHWPNTVLAGATGLAMLVWCTQWQRGRRLWILALVMGLAGAIASTLLPARVTGEMRIGPAYFDKRIEMVCRATPERCDAQERRRP